MVVAEKGIEKIVIITVIRSACTTFPEAIGSLEKCALYTRKRFE